MDGLNQGGDKPLEIVCSVLRTRRAYFVYDCPVGRLSIDQIRTQGEHHRRQPLTRVPAWGGPEITARRTCNYIVVLLAELPSSFL